MAPLILTLTLLITDGNLIIDFPGYTPERCNELKDIFNEEHPTKDFWAFCEVTNELHIRTETGIRERPGDQ